MTSSCQHVVDGPGQIWFSFQTIGAINFVRPQSILETLHYYTKRPLSSGTLQIFFSTVVIRISCIWLDSCKFDFHFKLSTPLFGTPLINCYHKSNCFKLFTSLVYLHWFFFQSSSLKYRVWWTGFFFPVWNIEFQNSQFRNPFCWVTPCPSVLDFWKIKFNDWDF